MLHSPLGVLLLLIEGVLLHLPIRGCLIALAPYPHLVVLLGWVSFVDQTRTHYHPTFGPIAQGVGILNRSTIGVTYKSVK